MRIVAEVRTLRKWTEKHGSGTFTMRRKAFENKGIRFKYTSKEEVYEGVKANPTCPSRTPQQHSPILK